MRFFEVFRIWEPLLLGIAIILTPSTVLRAIIADTARSGHFKTRRNIYWATAGLLCVAYFVMAMGTAFIHNPVFFPALGTFGSLVLASLVYDLWRTSEMPEEEPLFTSRRVFFTSWCGGSQWLVALTVLLPNAVRWEIDWPGSRWLYPALYVGAWMIAFLILSQKFDQERFFFQGTERVRWLFRLAGIVLGILALRLLYQSVSLLLLNGVLHG